jgi:hypothetical protein
MSPSSLLHLILKYPLLLTFTCSAGYSTFPNRSIGGTDKCNSESTSSTDNTAMVERGKINHSTLGIPINRRVQPITELMPYHTLVS